MVNLRRFRFKRRSKKPAKAIKKVVTTMLNRRGLKPEVKIFDNSSVIANIPLGSAAYATLLNNIAQSVGVSGRVGNIINIKSMDVRVAIAPKRLPDTSDATTGGVECMVGVRFMVVQDLQQVADDNTFDITTCLASTSADDRTLISPYTITEQKRYKVLYDRVRFCEIGKNYHYLRANLRFPKGLKTIYNGAGATDIQKNGIWLVIFYNDFGVPLTGTQVNDGPRFVAYARTVYTDL